ncbi:putative translation initiation factor [Trypoxylus dichotomus]
MPRLMAKVEGKGNGIKTVIVNMAEVAKALGRPPTYPTKYFGCELGAQTQFDFKNERFIVNGSHDAVKLQDLLDGFIRKFVLCPECENPETDLLVSAKSGTISQGCKNPPNLNPAVQGSSLTEGKRSKRSKRSNGETNGESKDGGTDGGDSFVEAATENNDDDSTQWTADVSDEAVRARMQDLTDGAKNMTINDDLEKPEKDRMNILYEMVKSKKDAGMLDNAQTQKDILVEAERLEIKTKTPLILAELLFDQNILSQIKKHRVLLLRFTLNDKKAQKYFMGGLEQLIALHHGALMAKVPSIFKVLYDLDILTESTFIEWADKVSKKYVSKEVSQEIHDKAAPFIKWLQEAESESEEESSEDDVEIEYTDRMQTTRQPPAASATPAAQAKRQDAEEEDDFDIDAI